MRLSNSENLCLQYLRNILAVMLLPSLHHIKWNLISAWNLSLLCHSAQMLSISLKSYIGVNSRPFCSEADSSISKHLDSCQKCFQGTRNKQFEHFDILRHCSSPCTAKIQKAPMIKRYNPKLIIQQFNKSASFTVKIYYQLYIPLKISLSLCIYLVFRFLNYCILFQM